MRELEKTIKLGEYTVDERYEIAKVAPAVEEYLGDHGRLRSHSISLRSYVETWQRDQGKPVLIPEQLSAALDRIQASVGGLPNPKNPLSFAG